MIGCKVISVRCRFMIGIHLVYVRIGNQIEWLEGWINPAVDSLLSSAERTTAIYLAKQQIMDYIKSYPMRQTEERNWKGVMYG